VGGDGGAVLAADFTDFADGFRGYLNPNRMNFYRTVFYFATTGLLLSVIIHGLAIAGVYPGGWVFVLHVAAIAAFAPLVFFLRKKATDRGKQRIAD
jgi:hypothetical protein